MSTLYRSGKLRIKRTRINSPGEVNDLIKQEMEMEYVPIMVHMPQWGTVGVNSTLTWFNPTCICDADTTRSSSRVFGCSGS